MRHKQPKYRLNPKPASFAGSVGSAPSDTDLLNWLERNPSWVSHAKGLLHGPDAWTWRDTSHNYHEAPSLRDAIRSAMKASEPNTPLSNSGD